MKKRRVTIETPLGDALRLRTLSGTDEISHLYAFDIDLISEDKNIDPNDLLGKSSTVVVKTQGGGERYLDGIVSKFGMQGQDHRWVSYKMRLRPWLWLGTRQSDYKIFQNQTVPEIIADVLAKYRYPIEKRLTRLYRTWDYCVQYAESDFNFVARLMESEGIYYYFEHQLGQHTLVLADDIVASHKPLPSHETIPFYPPEKAALAPEECIYAWELSREISPGRYVNDDYDFKRPKADLQNVRSQASGHAHGHYEIFEYPGGFTKYQDGDKYAGIRLEELQGKKCRVRGDSNIRGAAPGFLFTFENYPREDQNQQYLITAVHYRFEENPEVTSSSRGESGSIQHLSIEAHPASTPFRPQRVTPKPRTQGPQTAVVVGPVGTEIWTDMYGRVKVQFGWDRYGRNDENSSCWIRVSYPWAGSNYGGIYVPRIGQEVIVDFLSGDPDHPVITGCVYNADQMPPWGLPGNATQSGFLTRSTKGGAPGPGMKNGPGDANAIRFEDKKGAEQLWFHAQRDQLTEVERDEDKWVGNDRRKTIDRDETSHIKRDRTETVDRHERITVHGLRDEVVDGNETITIHSNRTERVDLCETISIGMNRNESVGQSESVSIGKSQSIDIGQSRSKKVGKHESQKIGRNLSVRIGRFKTETVGMACLQNVGLGKMVNIGAAYNRNVGMMMYTNVGMSRSDRIGMKHSATVGEEYTLKVGAGGGVPGAVSGFAGPVSGGQSEGSVVHLDGGGIALKVGKASIVLKEDGTIELTGTNIKIEARGGPTTIIGSDIDMNPVK